MRETKYAGELNEKNVITMFLTNCLSAGAFSFQSCETLQLWKCLIGEQCSASNPDEQR